MKNWVISNGMVSVKFDELVEKREKAIHIRIGKEKYWLPRGSIDFRDWSSIVEIPVWLATQKGLI